MNIRRREQGYTLMEVIISIGVLASLLLFMGGVAVLIHFIAKFW